MRQIAENRSNWGLCTLILALGSPFLPAQADDKLLTVTLASGREFTAQVDSRTGEELWLRFSSGGGNVLRPIAWSRITAARQADKVIEKNDLKLACEELKSIAPPRATLASPAIKNTAPSLPLSPALAFIRIDAWMANWDADVEPDGIFLQLQAFDENGEPTAVNGTADIELFAAQERKYHEAPQSGGWSTELIERWTEQVEAQQVGSRGVLLKLPLGAIHPDFTRGLDDWGLVHVRLVVPGSGVFEQSVDGVRLRSWSPVREQMFLLDGRRFFSTEGTQRH